MTLPDPTPLPPVYRHPLGLPAGSIRAILTLMIMVPIWLILLLPEDWQVRVPPALYALLSMVLHFFASHGHSIGPPGADQPSPWNLPRGFFRVLLLAGTALVVGWQYANHPDLLFQRLTPTETQLAQWPYIVLALLGGFGVGWLLGRGPWRRAAWFQDVLAWVSLLAMIGLVVEVILLVLVNPRLREELDIEPWERVLTAVVAGYFGARS
jgi:hypothetical protein